MELAQRRVLAGQLAQLLGEPSAGPVPVEWVSLRFGFLIAMALLVIVGFIHVAAAVSARTPAAEPEPVPVAG